MSKKVYTTGRPKWYNEQGAPLAPFVIGVAGGTASGKTTVCKEILRRLDIQWVSTLPVDSFYRPLSKEEHDDVANYNFDHPNAFDWELLRSTLRDLKQCKQVNVPNYNFVTHSREEQTTPLYGADVIIVEGIMALYDADVRSELDMKIFVDTDSDSCLARRIRRDVAERGRTVDSVLDQYERFVKPMFDEFVSPTRRYADIIVPRGADNVVAIDLICTHISTRLTNRIKRLSPAPLPSPSPRPLPNACVPLDRSNTVNALLTHVRDKTTSRDDFIHFADRLIHLTLERALDLVPMTARSVVTPTQETYKGLNNTPEICAVSVMRGGDAITNNLRKILRTGVNYGQILIQSDEEKQPALFYVKLPKRITEQPVLLCDPIIASGQSLMMALRVLSEHGVQIKNIIVVTLFSSRGSIMQMLEIFPSLRIVCVSTDAELNDKGWLVPGCGNFGNRYFGTKGDAAIIHSRINK
mmetsp:Transcript_14782/g.25350  ORF Transcript_14782/g.25350 Transcript_14782/m.25350 type:complete len:468 (+) Transcript_14782:25-1428(+)